MGLLCSCLSMRCVVVVRRQPEHLVRYLEGGLVPLHWLGLMLARVRLLAC